MSEAVLSIQVLVEDKKHTDDLVNRETFDEIYEKHI